MTTVPRDAYRVKQERDQKPACPWTEAADTVREPRERKYLTGCATTGHTSSLHDHEPQLAEPQESSLRTPRCVGLDRHASAHDSKPGGRVADGACPPCTVFSLVPPRSDARHGASVGSYARSRSRTGGTCQGQPGCRSAGERRHDMSTYVVAIGTGGSPCWGA
ncbi:hypothetical protein VTK73DRAFT_2021 [Phialemonium thermophilum]|uniref:Uncharacterized protein n=1 Tax=Phialemonium thermophilum TaxID=223376 RepID=A0ABR3VSN6_9PEZI